MKPPTTHIIHRVNLFMDVPDIQIARKMDDEAVRILRNDILPRLEKTLDKMDSPGEFFSAGEINLDLGKIPVETFEPLFIDTTEELFRERINSIVMIGKKNLRAAMNTGTVDKDQGAIIDDNLPEGIGSGSEEKRIFDAFCYFLVKGRLPWWCNNTGNRVKETAVLNAVHLDPDASVIQIEQILKSHPEAAVRLIFQYSAEFAARLLALVLSRKSLMTFSLLKDKLGETIENLHQSGNIGAEIETLKQTLRYWLNVPVMREEDLTSKPADFRNNKSGRSSAERTDLQAATTGPALHVEKENSLPGSFLHFSSQDDNSLYVSHAGLVVLHPFLESLFNELGLLDNGKFRDFPCREIAVRLLCFLATGDEQSPEYELTMEKYLCGIPLDNPVNRHFHLSDSQKGECLKLLRAVIAHWKVLKNTSPDGLREGFLQREGKLLFTDFQHRLIVGNKSHDVLLSWLPWGIGIIKLPWLEQVLYVDWN